MIETDVASGQPAATRPAIKAKFVIGGALIALAVVYLIVTAARSSTEYYLTVEELKGQGPSPRQVRVAGNVIGESIVWSPRDLRLEFQLADESGVMSVVHHGARPDVFRDEAQVVLEGQYTDQGIFEAKSMLLKCPSKYEEAAADG